MPPCRVGDVFEGGASGGEKACALRKELGDLERAEKRLDELIHSSSTQLKQLTEHEDSQRYPSHAAVRVSTCVFDSLVMYAVIQLMSAAVLTLDPAMYVGLCDVSGHPLHRQSARPDSHRREGPS